MPGPRFRRKVTWKQRIAAHEPFLQKFMMNTTTGSTMVLAVGGGFWIWQQRESLRPIDTCSN